MLGNQAEEYINRKHPSLCKLIVRDPSNKALCYKLTKGSGREFAFDPNQSSEMSVQFDIEPPTISGLRNVRDLSGKSLATTWKRVFSGGEHCAKWRAVVETAEALDQVIDYLASK